VRRYLASLVRLRGVWGWSGLALVLMPVLVLLSVVAGSALGRRPLAAYHLPSTGLSLLGLIVVKLLYQLFFFNATGEEVGWRGFALPRLQSRTSPLIAALIIALFWAPWHFFLWRAVGQPVTAWQFWGQQYVVHILASFLIVWIYNRARGSILVAGVTHAAANTALALFPGVDFATLSIVLAIAAAALIAADRMWAKLPRGHPAVFTPGESTAGRGAESAPAAAT
jgi:membrane protease YdiL (CAAX protease family)